jgi:hypothetical protein
LPLFLFLPKLKTFNTKMNGPMTNFEVFLNNETVFQSDSHWLHPIIELEKALKKLDVKPSSLKVHDKIIGRAAALLLVRLDIKNIHAHLLSQPAMKVLEYFKIKYSYDLLVDKIGCQTEDLLENEYDPETAYTLIKQRIKDNAAKNKRN